MKPLFAILLLLCAIVSCSQFETLEITAYSPGNHEYGVEETTPIFIEFNNDVEKSDIETNFILSGDSGRMEGQFTWASGKKFFFVPRETLQRGNRYTMELPRTVRDTKGNRMEEQFLSEFYVGSDLERPSVTSSEPAYVEGGAENISTALDRIVIRFSEPMDTMKTERAFSLSPDVPGYFEWTDNDATMIYHLTSEMEYGTLYTVTVSTSAEDNAGNSLVQAYRMVFLTGSDFQCPEIVGVYDAAVIPPPYWDRNVITSVSRTVAIAVSFSEAMDRTSVESAFSLTPGVNGSFTWNPASDRMEFTPEEPLAEDSVYTIRISSSAKDQNGRRTNGDYDLSVRTNAENSLHIAPGVVSGSNDGSTFMPLFAGSPAVWPVDINLGSPVSGTDYDYFIKIQFKRGTTEPVAMDQYSIFDNLLPPESFGAPGEPVIKDVTWNTGATELTIVLSRLNKDILYRFTISGGEYGIMDEFGNTMEDNFVFEFRDDN